MSKYFYTTGAIGLEYDTAHELYAFLQANQLSVDDWRNTVYETVATPLAWGELRTARAMYELIIEVYALAHAAQGGPVLQ